MWLFICLDCGWCLDFVIGLESWSILVRVSVGCFECCSDLFDLIVFNWFTVSWCLLVWLIALMYWCTLVV